MAKLYFSVEADYQKVIRLREEIAKLERQMRGFNSHSTTDAIESVQNELRDLRSEYNRLTKTAAKSGAELEKASLSMGKALAAVGGVAALKALGSEIIRVRGEFQEMETAIETLVGKSMSDKLIPQIKELAKVSPLTMTDIVGAEKMMLGFNIEADKTIVYLKALSDVSMGSSQKFNSLTLAFSQMSASGKLMGQDLNQMINAGFNPLQQIAKTTGKSIATLKEEMSKGAISAEMVQKAFIDATSAGGKFYKMSENASKTINGQISMMQDAWDAALNEMGTKSEGFIMSGIQATTSLIQNYETIGKVLVSLVATYGVYKAALIANIALEKAQAVQRLASIKGISTMSALTGVLTKKMALLNAVASANPWVLLATAITGAVVAMWAFHDSSTEAEKAQKRLAKKREEESDAIDEHNRKMDSLIEKSRDVALTDLQRGESLAELRKEYPNIFAQYDIESIKLADILDLKRQIAEEDAKRAGEKGKKDFADLNTQISALEHQAKTSPLSAGDVNRLTRLRADRDAILQERGKGISEVFISSLKDVDMSKFDDYVKVLENKIKGKGNDGVIKMKLPIDIEGNLSEEAIYNVKDIKNLIDTINTTKNKRIEAEKNKTTYKQDFQKAKKEWEDAKKELKKIEKDKDNFSTKQYEDAKKEEASKKAAYEKLGGKTDKQIEREEKADKKKKKEEQRKAEELLNIKRKAQQDEINLMKDGTEKRIKQINLDYQKELDAIERQKKDWEREQGGKLTDEQQDILNKKNSIAFVTWVTDTSKVKEDRIKAEKEAQRELIKLVGDYEQQKQAIKDEYTEKKKNTDIQAEKDLFDAQMNQELDSLDEKFGYATASMADLFEDASNKTVGSIQDIIDKYETLVAFMSKSKEPDGTNVTVDELKRLGFTDKDIEKIRTGEINIKDVTDRIKELKGELKGKSPFQTFSKDLEDAIKNLKNGKIGEGLSGIGNSVSSFAPALKEFSSNIGNIFGFDDAKIQGAIDAVDGLGQTAAGVGQIMSGDIVGGTMSAVAGISKVVDAFDGMFGADYSQYQKMVDEYNGLIEVWGSIIDKKREYINISYGDEARKAGQEALDLMNKELEAYKILGKERLNAGASAGSHSIGVRQRKRMSDEGWKELRNASKEIGFNYDDVASGRMTGLFDLTAKQLEDLKAKAPTFWAKLDEDVRTYLENIIESNDKLEEMKDLINESFTGVSFDSFYDGFISTLSDMDSSSKDFADNFEEYLKNAIISNLVANKYRDKIQSLYDSWASMSKNGLTEEEVAELQRQEKDITDSMIADRDALKETFGWGDSYSQEASSKASQAMSQDTGEELNGRFTALQISGEETKNQVTLLNITANEIKAIQMGIRDIAGGIQDQLASSYLELVAINENTGMSAKYLKDIKADISEVKENTKNL